MRISGNISYNDNRKVSVHKSTITLKRHLQCEDPKKHYSSNRDQENNKDQNASKTQWL